MLWSFLLQIAAGILGLFLAEKFGWVEFSGKIFLLPTNQAQVHEFFKTFIFIGSFLGLLNAVVKPILNKITFPLRIITLNLLSLIIAMAMIWITDIVFPELVIGNLFNLLWTTIIVWILGFILTKWLPSK